MRHHAILLLACVGLAAVSPTAGVHGLTAARAGAARPSGVPPVPFTEQMVDPTNAGDCKAIADVDVDGKPDLVVAGPSLVWYGWSRAGWAKHILFPKPLHEEFTTDMQAADVDGDGDPDIVIPDGGGPNNVLWIENPKRRPPAGRRADPTDGANWQVHVIGSHGAYVHDLVVGDIDRDDRLDVVTSGHGHTHVWLQRPGGIWLDRDLSSLAGQGVGLGDINRDGRIDIVTGSAWLECPEDPAKGGWIRHVIPGARGETAIAVDLNGDRRLDVVVVQFQHQPGKFAWYEAPPDPANGQWVEHVIDTATGSHKLESADFNGDGRPDLLTGLELKELAIWLNQGGSPATFRKQVVATSGGHNARVGRIGDRRMPCILSCDFITHPPVRVFLNDLRRPGQPQRR